VIAGELRTQSAQVARIDGAISGTPFLVALVPGYLRYLWQDPTVDAAREALLEVRDRPLPEKPATRRPLRTWVRSIHVLLIFGGFLSAPSDARDESAHPWLKASLGFVAGATLWVITWVLPLTFMIAMAWGCETHTRQLGRRALIFNDGEAETAQAAIAAAKERQDRGHGTRASVRAALLVLSVAVPIAFVAYVNHVRQSTGISWLAAIGALVALSLVVATTVTASRR
jgi:hypothetical protein